MEDPTPPAAMNPPPGRGVDWPAALQRHGRWLRRVILTRLGERQAVDEVMQEVCLAAVASAAPARLDGAQAGAWLYRVAVRQTLLYRRRCGRRRKLIDTFARRGPPPGDPGEAGDPLRWLLSVERVDLVRRAIERVPRRDADVLILKYADHWSYRQIAEHLGTTETAIAARLHRARDRLREELNRLSITEAPS